MIQDILNYATSKLNEQTGETPAASPSELPARGEFGIQVAAACCDMDDEDELQKCPNRRVDRQSYSLKLMPVCDLKIILYYLDKQLFSPWAIKALL